MPDDRSPEARRKTMQAVRSKNTSLERKLFSMLAGMRVKGWKKNVEAMIGRPDVVFSDEHVVILVDGCFWHSCPTCARKVPETNREFWETKLRRTRERDNSNTQILREDGWRVVRIWEHELRKGASRELVHRRIREALEEARLETRRMRH